MMTCFVLMICNVNFKIDISRILINNLSYNVFSSHQDDIALFTNFFFLTHFYRNTALVVTSLGAVK